jgi:RNA polymerase sigma factor (sigma-70 family)
VNIDSSTTATAHLDSALIKRAQQGDSDAFAALFHKHKMRIYSLCFRMTNNATEAEDLAQDAFLQVFRKLASFRGDSALSTWLHRIAVNTVLMHFRRKVPGGVSLDEPYISHKDAKPIRRQYGTRDGRLETSVARVALIEPSASFPRAVVRSSYCTRWKGISTARLQSCSDVPWEIRNRDSTKRNYRSGIFWYLRPSFCRKTEGPVTN